MALTLKEAVERVRGFDLERSLGLRPDWPGLALELDGRSLTTVRLKRRRRGLPLLEGYDVEELEHPVVPSTVFDTNTKLDDAEIEARLRSAFEAAGARPGRASLVLPDNLAKISLVPLPERPPSRKQLLEIIRFKMHRAVPFRFSEAVVTYQVIPTDGPGVVLLVALMRRVLVERFERLLESIGASPGLIDLATPNLLNLCRARVDQATGGDVALLNCTENYFTLLIVRDGRLIFFRCKSYGVGGSRLETANGLLGREVASSFSYYEEKLAGRGVGTILVRSVARPFEALFESLAALGVDRIESIDPFAGIELPPEAAVAPELGQRLAPAIGAAVGRG